MARKCLALNTLIFIFVDLQNKMDLLQMSEQNMNLSKRLDTIEGKSYKHFLSCATMGLRVKWV